MQSLTLRVVQVDGSLLMLVLVDVTQMSAQLKSRQFALTANTSKPDLKCSVINKGMGNLGLGKYFYFIFT